MAAGCGGGKEHHTIFYFNPSYKVEERKEHRSINRKKQKDRVYKIPGHRTGRRRPETA
jgi:hypothetical protein